MEISYKFRREELTPDELSKYQKLSSCLEGALEICPSNKFVDIVIRDDQNMEVRSCQLSELIKNLKKSIDSYISR
ncbi:hypothetical protein J4477_00145 [Candidatus Pacearchaeota archaeon]|nr:hypothetical protein [Candidatus Pacearchaeota archaeon]